MRMERRVASHPALRLSSPSHSSRGGEWKGRREPPPPLASDPSPRRQEGVRLLNRLLQVCQRPLESESGLERLGRHSRVFARIMACITRHKAYSLRYDEGATIAPSEVSERAHYTPVPLSPRRPESLADPGSAIGGSRPVYAVRNGQPTSRCEVGVGLVNRHLSVADGCLCPCLSFG